MSLKFTILGSGGWMGIPRLGGESRVDKIAFNNPDGKNSRTRPEFQVETSEGSYFLEMGPDLRLQCITHNLKTAQGFFLSHIHSDHSAGIGEVHGYTKFRHRNSKFRVYCSLVSNLLLKLIASAMPLERTVLKPFETVRLCGTEVTPFPVYHMRNWDNNLVSKFFKNKNCFGYQIKHNGKKLSYLSDYYEIPEESKQLIRGSNIVIADGTYLFNESKDLIENGFFKTMNDDLDHLHGDDIINYVSRFDAEKVIYFSIQHPYLTHNELNDRLPNGHEISYDGMKIEL
jgi:phosphoribosyl 1,2-cyclic phosphate phosphodiesterase